MALVKCKECGSDVSTKAKACPKCGAKAPKKTSLFTWLVTGFVAAAMIGVFTSDPSSTSNRSASASSGTGSTQSSSGSASATTNTPPVVKAPEWRTFESSDEMTGEKSAYAVSPNAEPTQRMGFPYGDVEAWLGIGCDASSEWAYIGFTQAPNLINGEIGDGYHSFRVRVRWDENVVFETLRQKWTADAMHFYSDASIIQKIGGASSAMVELNWYGEGAVRFPFTLNGSSKALQNIRGKCARY
ncbi:zinc ribbon domain-containing protein [Marinobacter alkaliphilus]|uniref:Zinc ribbon domain-containing protein n=1 Tax=Marinobacter alkaliphilus TaxID=254719 RepID=A0ABZ3E7Y5_9GAMM